MITIDGKEYKEEDLSTEQKQIASIISSLQKQKGSAQLQIDNLNVLLTHYVDKLKKTFESK
jgi:hypothetical protein